MRLNIAIAGGPCTGKSVLAAALFAELKSQGFDYDLVTEERRKLHREFGNFRDVFERFYMWRQQEREEKRSSAKDGFITDYPLFHLYTGARTHARSDRDQMAVRELFRMCTEIQGRYHLIVIAENSDEIRHKKDKARKAGKNEARMRHALIRSFLEHFLPDRILFVRGSVEKRVAQVCARLDQIRRK